MQGMRAVFFSTLLLAGCASDSGVRVGVGIGSFGGSGGVSVGGSTTVGGGGSHKNPAPFEQLWLEPEIVAAVFAAEQLPFTATEEQVKALNDYAKSDAVPNLGEAEIAIVGRCKSGKSRCRINPAAAQPDTTEPEVTE